MFVIIDNVRVILIFSIVIISTVFNSISFSIAEDDTKAAPKPRLTAVFMASIEFSSIITLNCLV